MADSGFGATVLKYFKLEDSLEKSRSSGEVTEENYLAFKGRLDGMLAKIREENIAPLKKKLSEQDPLASMDAGSDGRKLEELVRRLESMSIDDYRGLLARKYCQGAPARTPASKASVFSEAFEAYKRNIVAFILGILVFGFGSILVVTMPPLLFGLYYMGLKAGRGEKVGVKDIFKGFDYFAASWVLLLAQAAAVFVGFILLVIPGLWLIVVTQYAIPLALVENQGGISALKRSVGIGKRNFLFTAKLFMVVLIVEVAGMLIPYIGGLLAMPYAIICTSITANRLART